MKPNEIKIGAGVMYQGRKCYVTSEVWKDANGVEKCGIPGSGPAGVEIKDLEPVQITGPEIQNRKVTEADIDSPVTYIPDHANGDASHPNSERGHISSFNEKWIWVRFRSSTGERCDPKNLVWG